VKAAFLYHFTQFVEWPAAREASAGRFVVAVLGADRFFEVAERTLAGKSSRDLTFAVRRVRRPAEAEDARIVFVGASEAGRVDEILRAVPETGVLTVSDMEEFAEHGGMIGFRTVNHRVRFDINLEAANRSGLKISSEVLKLARLVRGKAP
jgi:hypothetical protein